MCTTFNMEDKLNPYFIFPEEMWEIIMENLLSTDKPYLQPLFSTFPRLAQDFKDERQLWLFPSVLPLVLKYLTSSPESVRACRLVCKTWRQAIDYFLSNHPSRRSYGVNGMTRRTVPYDEINFVDDPDVDTFKFNTIERMEEFTKLNENKSMKNIFNGRTVAFFEAYFLSSSREKYLDAVLNFLDVFGSDIRSIYFEIPLIMRTKIPDGSPDKETFTRIMTKILQCLSKLTNVRSLTLQVRLRTLMPTSGDIVSQGLESLLPQLPSMESLTIISPTSPPGVEIDLVEYFQGQVKTLKVGYTTLMFSIRSAVPNVVELEICINSNLGLDGVDWNEDLLSKLPNVRKLKLWFDEYNYFQEQLTMHQLLQFINPLQHQLEELYFHGCVLSENNHQLSNNALPQFTKLKYLNLTDWHGQKYDILHAFTNLEHLALVKVPAIHEEYYYRDLPMETDGSLSVETKLKYYMYSSVIPVKADIFYDLENLKMITIHDLEHDLMIAQFAREMKNNRITLTD